MLVFDRLFSLFWDTNPIDLNGRKGKSTIQGSFNKKSTASVVMLGVGQTGAQEEEAKNVSGANAAERLKKTDLSLLNTMEAAELDEIARKLFRQMVVRMRRRMKQDLKSGRINLRRTIRKSLSTGGEPVDLFYRMQTPRKQRLIVLLDVSGSMDKYSFFFS